MPTNNTSWSSPVDLHYSTLDHWRALFHWFYQYIMRKTDDQLNAFESDQDKQDAIARAILMEMMVEYIGIILTPTLIASNHKNSINFRFGYNIDGNYDNKLLLFSILIALVVEITVDVICFKYQEKHYRMKEAWVSITGESKLWFKVFPMFTITTLMTTLLLLAGFHQPPYRFSPDPCTFVNKCVPYPCSQCYNVDFNNSTASILPPMLQEMCSRLSNSSSALYD